MWYMWHTGATGERLHLIGKGIEYLLQLSLHCHIKHWKCVQMHVRFQQQCLQKAQMGKMSRSTFPTLKIQRWKTFVFDAIGNVSILMSFWNFQGFRLKFIKLTVWIETDRINEKKNLFRRYPSVSVKTNKSWNRILGFVFHFKHFSVTFTRGGAFYNDRFSYETLNSTFAP